MSLYKVENFHLHIMYFSPVGKVKYMRKFIHCRLSFHTCCWQWCCCESIFSSFCADVCVYLAIELFGMPHDTSKCASAKTFYVVRHSWSWFCMQNIPIDAKCLHIQIELVLLQLLYVLRFHSRTFTFRQNKFLDFCECTFVCCCRIFSLSDTLVLHILMIYCCSCCLAFGNLCWSKFNTRH